MMLDIEALPWKQAAASLQEANISYTIEMTRPTRNFFPVDENRLYVVRQRVAADGKLMLTLAAKQVPMEEV
ncbi:MAG: aliphatic sulfonate ABC transporter [Selenomonas sp.]|uniref:aliphatic sulfonate ABC transporter n=1 Tax=Selenomonas sp. TaxID=2053611 RepID=UPI0025E042C7|nr:aliphatic sulfonate ABC transporter [Selenomonas sp.]MCR5757178.1 aliphatic sulfonate ABC transporter [Selenomonas sp.]